MLSIADRETDSPSRSIRITFKSVVIRWWATEDGSAVGRCEGAIGAFARELEEEVAAAGFGAVEKRMTWWKKRDKPRSKTDGTLCAGLVQTLSCTRGEAANCQRPPLESSARLGLECGPPTHEVLEHVPQLAHASNVVLPNVPNPVEEQLPRRGRRNVFAGSGARSCLPCARRGDRVDRLRERRDDLVASFGFEVGRDEFGDGVVEQVTLCSPTPAPLARSVSRRNSPVRRDGSHPSPHLLMEDEVVRVAVMLLERELRDVVVLDLLDRLFQLVERRVNRLGLLWGQARRCQLRHSRNRQARSQRLEIAGERFIDIRDSRRGLTFLGALTLGARMTGLRTAIFAYSATRD